MNTLTKILGIAMPIILMAGCKPAENHFISKRADYKGNTVFANLDVVGRRVAIYSGKVGYQFIPIDHPHVGASEQGKPKGRFDEIYLDHVSKGNVLEKYASLQEMETAYEFAMKTGTDTEKAR